MPRKPASRIVRTVTDRLWERDRRQMRAVDALLSAGTPPRRRSTRQPLQRTATRWAGFRSLLCPIDFSEPSRRALRQADAIARRDKAALKVLYVTDPLLVAAAAAALHDRELLARSRHELHDFVTATITPVGRGRSRVTVQVSIGDAADEILKAAKKDRADLIVIGTRGLSGAQRLVLGSTTQDVLKGAAVPVLACPPRWRPR